MILGILLGTLVIVIICGYFCYTRVKEENHRIVQQDPDNLAIADEVTQTSPINSKLHRSNVIEDIEDNEEQNGDNNNHIDIDMEQCLVSNGAKDENDEDNDEQTELVPST